LLKLSLKSISPFIAASVMLLLALLHQLNQQFINNFGLDQCGVHIKTNQTSVSSKHIVLLKEISTSIVLEISIKLAVNKALFSILPDTDNCTQERGYSSFNNNRSSTG
jgi:hypothetical protein